MVDQPCADERDHAIGEQAIGLPVAQLPLSQYRGDHRGQRQAARRGDNSRAGRTERAGAVMAFQAPALEREKAGGGCGADADACGRYAAMALGGRPVLLCSARIRRHLRRLSEERVPQMAVCSYNEIAPGVGVETLAVLGSTHGAVAGVA